MIRKNIADRPLKLPPGPSIRSFFLFLLMVVAAYFPLKKWGEPALAEIWFRQVICRMVTDAHTLEIPGPGKMALGATRPELPQSLYGMDELQSTFGGRVSLISFYQAWGEGPLHAFPTEALYNMRKAGYTPIVTWEPWLSEFVRYGSKEPQKSLALIASGKLDAYTREWARGATRYGTPIFLRIAHEPTNPLYPWTSAYGNTPEMYGSAWKRIRSLFLEEGARNVSFVWTPFGLLDSAFFPGKDQVDWIGLDLFNYGALSEQGTWIDFYSLAKLYVDQYRSLGVPMLAAEVGTSSAGGSKADWIRDMFRALRNGDLPELKALVLFDIPAGHTATGLPINWSLSEIRGVDSLIQREQFDTLFTLRPKAALRSYLP